jgi:hypothetical protein
MFIILFTITITIFTDNYRSEIESDHHYPLGLYSYSEFELSDLLQENNTLTQTIGKIDVYIYMKPLLMWPACSTQLPSECWTWLCFQEIKLKAFCTQQIEPLGNWCLSKHTSFPSCILWYRKSVTPEDHSHFPSNPWLMLRLYTVAETIFL